MCSAYSKQLFYLKYMSFKQHFLRKTDFCMAGNYRLTFHPSEYYNTIRGINPFEIYIYYSFYTIA